MFAKGLGSKVKLVDDPEQSTQELDVKVADKLRINMYLLCKLLGYWF